MKRPAVQFRFYGDEKRAETFSAYALQKFNQMLDSMEFNDVKTLRLRIPIDPLGKVAGFIDLYKSYDINIISILAEGEEKEIVEEIRPRWEPWNGTNDYICVNHNWEVIMQTDIYTFPATYHSNVNDYPTYNDSICNVNYTWPATGGEENHFYWFNLAGGFLTCTVYQSLAKLPSDYYQTFHVAYDYSADTINTPDNIGAQYLELAARAWADGLAFGTTYPNVSYCAFWARDENNNYWVWYLAIDEQFYNVLYAQDPTHQSFIGDLGFSTGSSGAPIILKLSDYNFDSDIKYCGFTFETYLGEKDTPGGGRNTMLSCDYIDFY